MAVNMTEVVGKLQRRVEAAHLKKVYSESVVDDFRARLEEAYDALEREFGTRDLVEAAKTLQTLEKEAAKELVRITRELDEIEAL